MITKSQLELAKYFKIKNFKELTKKEAKKNIMNKLIKIVRRERGI